MSPRLLDISSDLAKDSPLFLEIKLKELFNSFLAELSQKFENLPGSLIENCVLSFSSRMTESMYNLNHTEVFPILFNKIMAHPNNSEKGVPSLNLKGINQSQLMHHLLDKLDSLQDKLHINDSQVKKTPKITEKMNDLILNENNRFEQWKRRLSDTWSYMNDKVP
ncbi:uncharacterized protein VP01_2770g2 [Puccinia sorghi]|uniref:Uncharacterized protein n=1 Tax=Puccinia sorghi TaxID=27349 RepID=A0A0L6V2T0_9BASI|nr:uncharacterized protein VP01_2770g2 [Puccinia sorghi]